MDVTVKHPWHEQLHQLIGLPLVACGGDKRPLQKDWQKKSLTPEEIIAEQAFTEFQQTPAVKVETFSQVPNPTVR